MFLLNAFPMLSSLLLFKLQFLKILFKIRWSLCLFSYLLRSNIWWKISLWSLYSFKFNLKYKLQNSKPVKTYMKIISILLLTTACLKNSFCLYVKFILYATFKEHFHRFNFIWKETLLHKLKYDWKERLIVKILPVFIILFY